MKKFCYITPSWKPYSSLKVSSQNSSEEKSLGFSSVRVKLEPE